MEWHKIWSKSLQTSLQLLALTAVALCDLRFKVQPMMTTELEHANVTMYCILNDLQPSIHEVRWYREGVQISAGANIIPLDARLRIEEDADRGEYNLMINHVTLADDRMYKCAVYTRNTNDLNLESAEARLVVHHVPPSQYPSCFPLTQDSFQEGEQITITCQSKRGNPPVTLMWTRQGAPLPTHTEDTQDFRNIDYTFTVGPENHGDIFQCKLTTSATNTVHRSCSLGPLDVTFSPVRVEIDAPQNIVVDQEIELICDSKANPPPSYTWTFSEKIDQSRISYSDNNKRIIFRAALLDDGLIIGCNATNDLGRSTGAITLDVRPAITNPIYGTTPSKEEPPNGDDSGGAPSKPQTDPTSSNNIILKPEVLAIIASTLTLILLVLIVLIVVTCRCRSQSPKTVTQMPQMIYGQYGPSSIQGWEQGSIYFEPRDHISVRDMPTWQRPAPWHRNVAVQVPWVEEPPYEEIGQNWDEGMTLEI